MAGPGRGDSLAVEFFGECGHEYLLVGRPAGDEATICNLARTLRCASVALGVIVGAAGRKLGILAVGTESRSNRLTRVNRDPDDDNSPRP